MDVRIGVSQTTKELEIEMDDDVDPAAVKADLDKAIADETTFWITDKKGRQVGVPAGKIAYLEIGAPESARRIGFGG